MFESQSYRVTCVIRKLVGQELDRMCVKEPEATYSVWYRRGRKERNHGITPFVSITNSSMTWRAACTFECTMTRRMAKDRFDPKILRLTVLQRPYGEDDDEWGMGGGGSSKLVPLGMELCVDLSEFMPVTEPRPGGKDVWFAYVFSETTTCRLYVHISAEIIAGHHKVLRSLAEVDDDTSVGSTGMEDEEDLCQGDIIRSESRGTAQEEVTSKIQDEIIRLHAALAQYRRESRLDQTEIENIELHNDDLRMKLDHAELRVKVEKKRAMNIGGTRMVPAAPGSDRAEPCVCANNGCVIL
eukprot:PhF_6_TR11243/c0_g1_i1/m.18135